MFHGVGLNYAQNQRLEYQKIREGLNAVLSDQKRIGAIICKHTDISATQSKALFRKAQTKDVGYAIDKGIINEVRDVEITAGAPVVSLVFQR